MSEALDGLLSQIAALEAEGSLREMVPLLYQKAELVRVEHGSDSSAYVAALNETGGLLRALKDLDSSEREFVKAAEIEALARGTDNPDYATCINNLAGTYRLKGEFEQAERLFEEAIDIYARQVGTEHFVYLSALNNLGLVYQDQSRYEEARALHEQALEVLKRNGRRDATYATTLNNLASVSMATR